jgi:ankyrin repeat protein
LVCLLALICSISICGCRKEPPLTPESAHAELDRRGIDYTENSFVKSAKKGDSEVVKIFLIAGMDPSSIGESGRTALMEAAFKPSEPTVELLLEAGASLHSVDQRGWTPLHWAAVGPFSQKAIVALLSHGAQVDAATPDGVTPLMASLIVPAELNSQSGRTLDDRRLETVRILLDQGANVNAMTKAGATPLMRAALSGSARAVSLLLEQGADPSKADQEGRTAQQIAILNDHEDVAAIIERESRKK